MSLSSVDMSTCGCMRIHLCLHRSGVLCWNSPVTYSSSQLAAKLVVAVALSHCFTSASWYLGIWDPLAYELLVGTLGPSLLTSALLVPWELPTSAGRGPMGESEQVDRVASGCISEAMSEQV